MKSLVEEASSITKAIEKAWIRAGKPQTFSVKIFENPEVGFLGFTKKSAKVGIFFEESVIEKSEITTSNNHQTKKVADHASQNRNNQKNFNRNNTRNAHAKQVRNIEKQETVRTENQQKPLHREHQQGDQPKQHQEQRENKRRSSHNRPARNQNRNAAGNREQRQHRQVDRKEQTDSVVQSQKTPITPVQEQKQQPVNTVAVSTQSASLKKAPKFSGRRFSQTKKEEV